MIYSFITEQDLDLGMKKYFREQITELQEKQHIQVTSEGAAFSMIKAKINNRYNLALLFPKIADWASTTAYALNDYAEVDNVIYQAIQAGTNQLPTTTNSTYWKVADPRDPLLVVYCAVLTIYFMMRSVCPRKISDSLEQDYAGILEWLDDVKQGNENPDWPLLENGSSNIQWGSNEKIEHYY